MTHHPSESDLALFAGRDLGWLAQWRVGRHTAVCAPCASVAAEFEEARRRVKSGDPLAGVEWNRLAAEMEANIHLGLEAGECVGPARSLREVPAGWRMVTAYAAALVLVVGLVWWQRATHRVSPAAGGGMRIAAVEGAIEMSEGGRAIGLVHERGAAQGKAGGSGVTYSAAADGGMAARYIDADGYVTIQSVVSSE
ncbi:MAG: hypothetical protein ACKV22_17390 [Bryobacteraceae bacterium]